MERSDGPGLATFSPRALKWITPLLIVVGIQCWLVLGRGDYGLTIQLKLLLGALLLSFIPPVNRFAYAILDAIRHPSPRAVMLIAIGISIASAIYFPFTGWRQGRNFMPKWQDELSYIIQFQMLAHGRLWMPQHACADFFDAFQLIVKPVYASMYFPGAAMMYAPMTWLHLPYWWVSTAACGIAVGLIYLILTELIDGVAGAVAALMLIGTSMYRKLSLMIGGHPPVTLLGLLMIYCWLRWRRSERPMRWAIAIGALAGWAAITRPLDAIVFAMPIGIDMLLSLRGKPAKTWLRTAACFIVPALPFIGIQIVFDLGVTGKWSQTPFQLYADRDYPGTMLGFHDFDPNLRPASSLPQKQKFHDEWTVPAIKGHTPQLVLRNWFTHGFEKVLTDLLPNRMMFVFLPAGILGLFVADRRRWLLWLLLPAFVILFSFYTFGLPHYAIIAAPAAILMIILGARQIELAWPRFRKPVAVFVTAFLVILSLTEMAEFNRFVRDELFDPQGLRESDIKLAALDHKPAVVLFHFPPDGNPHEEPVYNTDVAWPDDAPVIRAHDLGARNGEIFRYYAQHQPQRAFYLYDRADDSVRFLGFATDLARSTP